MADLVRTVILVGEITDEIVGGVMRRGHETARDLAGRLSGAAAEAWIPHTCFKHGPPRRIGIELELLVHDRRDPGRPTDGEHLDPLRDAALALPLAGRATVEPGGQLEISSTPHDTLPAALTEVAEDLTRLRDLAAAHGTDLTGLGVDPRPVGRRVLADPRYDAMEAYLDRWGPAGRTMMRRTASVQVNLEASDGSPGDRERRWRVLHAVGPPLVAAFANSPGPARGPWSGWACSRMAVWLALDPARTRPPRPRPGEGLPAAWARWCLDAPLMLVRRPQGGWAPPRATFRQWIDGGRAVVPDRPGPDVGDLAYHLTTLFPPVRARGHLEVRYVDAQPGGWWPVPAAVLWAVTGDRRAGDVALDACAAVTGRWRDAARAGLRDDALATAALGVLDAAEAALAADPDPATAACAALVAEYRDRWTARRRSPGTDRAEGVPPPPAPPVPRALPAPAAVPPARHASARNSPVRNAPVRKDPSC